MPTLLHANSAACLGEGVRAHYLCAAHSKCRILKICLLHAYRGQLLGLLWGWLLVPANPHTHLLSHLPIPPTRIQHHKALLSEPGGGTESTAPTPQGASGLAGTVDFHEKMKTVMAGGLQSGRCSWYPRPLLQSSPGAALWRVARGR